MEAPIADRLSPRRELLNHLREAAGSGDAETEDEIAPLLTRLADDIEAAPYCFDEIQEDVNAATVIRFQAYFDFLDLAILEHANLFLTLQPYFGILSRGSKDFASEPPEKLRRDQVAHFTLILPNLVNLLLGVRRLLVDGLALPAKSAARSFGELSDVGGLVLADREFFERYSVPREDLDEAKNIWSANATPRKLERRLERAHAAFYGHDEAWQHFSSMRKNSYSWFSTYAHPDFLASFFAAHSRVPDEDRVELTLGGSASLDVRETLRRVIPQAFFSINFATAMLVEHHGLAFARFGEEGLYHVLLHDSAWRTFTTNAGYFGER